MYTTAVKVRIKTAATVLLACLLIAVAAGCASSGSKAIELRAEPAPGPAELVDGVLPLPSELKAAQQSHIFSDVFHLADQYVEAWPRQRVAATTDNFMWFEPDFTSFNGGNEPAFAIYSFDTGLYDHESTINVHWWVKAYSGEPWVGLADFDRDTWRWYQPNDQGAAVFDEAACISEGFVYAVVVVTGDQPWQLAYVYLGSHSPPHIVGVGPRSGVEGEEITLMLYMKGIASAERSVSEFLDWSWWFGPAATPDSSTEASPTITLVNAGIYSCSVTGSGIAGDGHLDFLLTVNQGGSGWEIEAVAESGAQGGPTSLALESGVDENPHIGFQDLDAGHLFHAELAGGAWLTNVVSFGIPEYGFTQDGLALDGFDRPHLAYTVLKNLVYAYRDRTSWEVEIVDEATAVQDPFIMPSLALDSGGLPQIAYHEGIDDDDWDSDAVLRSYYDGANWLGPSEVAFSGGMMETGTIDVFNPLALYNNEARICYYDTDAPRTLHLAFEEIGWPTEEIATGVDPVAISMVLDPNTGHPHIAYVNKIGSNPGTLVYAYYDGDSWERTTISGTGDVGPHVSIALDLASKPIICYYAATSGDLAYATRDGFNWNLQPIEQHGDVGQFCSMATGADGRAHVSYYDETNGYVKYAHMPEM